MAALSNDDLLQRKKREHLRELEKLRREAVKAERDCRLQISSLFHPRSGGGGSRSHRSGSSSHRSGASTRQGTSDAAENDDLETLGADVKRISSEREAELKMLFQQLTTAKIGVKKFKECVAKSKQRLPPSPAVMEDLRSKMVDVESNVSAFKSKQKSVYDELNRLEAQCVNEISSLEKKMVAWEQQQQRPLTARGGGGGKAASARLYPSGGAEANVELPAAVVTFEKFQQQSGGICGGWNEEDHAIFLRLRLKHKGKAPAFIEEALPLLAPRSREDLESHEEWFREYEGLLDAKKKAIEEWRMEKREKQKEESGTYRETEEQESDKKRQTEAERREREEIERAKNEAEVLAWKEAKEEERLAKEEQEAAMKRESKKKEEASAARKAIVKAQAEEFAREREEVKRVAEEAEARKERLERDRKRKTAAEEILKFQERDQMTVAQRIVFNQKRVFEEEEKVKRLEKMKENVVINVERDPERLVKLTKGMEERKKAKEEEEEELKRRAVKGVRNGGANFNVRQIQHRATPSWRSGV